MNKETVFRAAHAFALEGEILSILPTGSGHIHDTYSVTTNRAHYILQRINTNVFTQPDEVMENIRRIGEYLSVSNDSHYHVLNVISTTEEKPLYRDADGSCWRVYPFIEGGIVVETANSLRLCQAAGLAFGDYQYRLRDFPAEQLHETIPGFHDTPGRFQNFLRALQEDALGRACTVKEEIDFFLAREKVCFSLQEAHEAGKLPLRVTHNDTKINNCILNAEDLSPLCILDLDTVMPGFAVNDFGDSIRSGAGTAAEDEPESRRMQLDIARYEAYLKGFLQGCRGALSAEEIRLLPMGALMMTLECGMRFLTDYLSGDTYFKIDHPRHNLDRCRTQMALVKSIEENWELLAQLSEKYL